MEASARPHILGKQSLERSKALPVMPFQVGQCLAQSTNQAELPGHLPIPEIEGPQRRGRVGGWQV